MRMRLPRSVASRLLSQRLNVRGGSAMSVFLCWSGTRSHKLAQALGTLLKSAFPSLTNDSVFVSDNIEKGVAWFDSIIEQLKTSHAGIVCLTAENLGNSWLHFEAGALAGGLARAVAAGESLAKSGAPSL